MAQKKEKNLKYKVFSIRLQDETREWLKLKKSQSNISWNRFMIKILKAYERKND